MTGRYTMNRQGSDSADGQEKASERLLHRRYLGLPLIIWASGTLIVILVWLAVSIPNPTESQVATIRFLMAVCGAAVSTVLFGHLAVKGTLHRFHISATGPMAVFFLLQFVANPIRLVSPSPPTGQFATVMGPRPCDEEGMLRSIHGKTRSTVSFQNDGEHSLKLYWLDYDGKRQPYGTLEPHPPEPVTQPTFLTHPWLVADATDRCLAIYLPETATPVVTIH